jgi:disulfide bond formation protein DsbB
MADSGTGTHQRARTGPARLAQPRLLLGSATVVATLATVGSLWLQFGMGLVPCELCWYQRLFMYPLVGLLGVGALGRRPHIVRTVLPLALTGGAIAAYHSYLQATTATCTLDGACASVVYTVGGLSIPNLSLLAFLLIIVGSLLAWYVRD